MDDRKIKDLVRLAEQGDEEARAELRRIAREAKATPVAENRLHGGHELR